MDVICIEALPRAGAHRSCIFLAAAAVKHASVTVITVAASLKLLGDLGKLSCAPHQTMHSFVVGMQHTWHL